MQLSQWAREWGISDDAMQALVALWSAPAKTTNAGDAPLSEAGVQSRVRLEASRVGARLWRNNVGAVYTQEGSFIRYGLANESSQINRVIKSADLIGIRPIVITSSHIGATIGQFVSREVKRTEWRYAGNDREKAQLAWAQLILSLGGDASFTTGEGSL